MTAPTERKAVMFSRVMPSTYSPPMTTSMLRPMATPALVAVGETSAPASIASMMPSPPASVVRA